MFDFDRYHIDAEIIEDSTNPINNSRISTLKVRVPRMILAEFNTHRCLAGETRLLFLDHDQGVVGHSFFTIERLYKGWNGDEAKMSRDVIKNLPLAYYDPETDQVLTSHITDIWLVGKKKTFVVNVDGIAAPLVATADHLVLTDTGWKEVQQIEIGKDKLITYRPNETTELADVLSITEGEEVDVYDVAVDNDYHNFFANHVVVHNCFSRNFSSSRAIPSYKIREEVLSKPMMPVYWGANKSGMSASEELQGWRKSAAKFVWRFAGTLMAGCHWILDKLGLHKQTCNRIVEPWLSVTGTVTSTEWDNFFALRLDENAQPEMQCLAHAMKEALNNSEPNPLNLGDIHLPYIDEEERQKYDTETLIQISAARCCRTSYNNMLGKKSQPEEDVKLYNRVSKNGHFSPLEHIAMIPANGLIRKNVHKNLQRNFNGWYQFRSFIDNKSNTEVLKANYDLDFTNK